MRTFVTAEAASCHGGFISRAHEMVEIAVRAGADACKFQWTSDAAALAARRHVESADAYQLLQFPEGWHTELSQHCANVNIEYMCTVYLAQDIDVIAPYVKRFKIASCEAPDFEFVAAHHRYWPKPVLISTGMFSVELGQLFLMVESLPLPAPAGWRFLHCVSAYPAPLDQLNLAAIRAHHLGGFSDHSGCLFTGALAVAAGAQFLEVHFRHPATPTEHPDYLHSLTADGLSAYIGLVRTAEQALGDGIKRVLPSEEPMLQYRVRG